MRPSPKSRVVFGVAAAVCCLSLGAHAAAAYTVAKVLDSTTPKPGGGTFTLHSVEVGATSPTMDGDTVIFFDERSLNHGESGDLWSVQTTGGAGPVKLVDAATVAPGNSGPFSTAYSSGGYNLSICNGSGGKLLFSGHSPEGFGYYTVPSAGGAITTIVNPAKTQPNLQVGQAFEHLGQAILQGSQVFFEVEQNDNDDGEGIYAAPTGGGVYTVLADKTTRITGDPNGTFYPGGPYLAVNASTVAFEPELSTLVNGNTAIYTAPNTGLTLDSQTGFVNNATRIAGGETAVPSDPQGRLFDATSLRGYLDDSGAVVFSGYPVNDPGSAGLYTSVDGVISRLADNSSTFAGDPGHFADVGLLAVQVTQGMVYFTADHVATDGTEVAGIYAAPAGGGPIIKVVQAGDALPDGSLIQPSDFGPFGVSSNGKIAFHGSYLPANGGFSVNAIFVATPGPGSAAGATELILSNHTGGDTGPATLIITPAPGVAAFVAGATFALTAPGKPDISGKDAVLSPSGAAYAVTFDLNSQADGLYDLVLTNLDGSKVTQPGAFTIETAQGPILYGDVLGPAALLAGAPQIYNFLVGNRGDTDAAAVPIFISFPSYFQATLVQPVVPIPAAASADPGFDYSKIATVYPDGDHHVMALLLPRVSAGTLRTVQVEFNVPDVAQYSTTQFEMDLNLGEPLLDAETGLAPQPGSGAYSQSLPLVNGCAQNTFNQLVDCGAAILPPLSAMKCSDGLISTTTASILSNLASDNYTKDSIALSYYQVEGTFFVGLAACAAGITPEASAVINAAQCGIDACLLTQNCISPLIRYQSTTLPVSYPNNIVGGGGDAGAGGYVSGVQPLRYGVYFENVSTASAPAQAVTITNPLDSHIDLTTFSLGPIGFGLTVLNPPAGSTSYSDTVDLRPGMNLLVQVTANLDAPNRLLTYKFQSLDPSTNQPPTDPAAGFLPPDVNAPAGDGYVVYSAKLKAGVGTNGEILDQASIVFNANAPIQTQVWDYSTDTDAPKSQIAALPKQENKSRIELRVTGNDVGSGVAYYNIFVGEDGGSFQELLQNAPGPEITYDGVAGHKYAFFSQAVDGAGNFEPVKTAADAMTKIVGADLIGSWDGDGVTEKTNAAGKVRLKGKFTVLNQSAKQPSLTGSVVRFYLCASATFDGSQQVIGADAPFGPLAAGASAEVSLTGAKLSSASAVSGKYVIAVIDPDKQSQGSRSHEQPGVVWAAAMKSVTEA